MTTVTEKFQSLVNGNTGKCNVGATVGTEQKVREAIWSEFSFKFQDNLSIAVKGVKIKLDAIRSKSGKTTHYTADLTPEQFTTITGDLFVGRKSETAYIKICFGKIQIYNGDNSYRVIPNSQVHF